MYPRRYIGHLRVKFNIIERLLDLTRASDEIFSFSYSCPSALVTEVLHWAGYEVWTHPPQDCNVLGQPSIKSSGTSYMPVSFLLTLFFLCCFGFFKYTSREDIVFRDFVTRHLVVRIFF